MLRKPASSSPGNLGYSTPSKGSNAMEGSLSPISCLGARLCPPPPLPGSNYQASACALGVQRAGPARPRRPRPRPARPAGGVRNPGCVPRAMCSPASPSPGHRCARACAPSCPSSPRGRYSRRKAARRRARWAGGAAGCVALGSALLLALPAPSGRPPRRGGAEGRSGQPRPRRRLEARPVTQAGARGAPCREPRGTAQG